jgi:hypothetical protein
MRSVNVVLLAVLSANHVFVFEFWSRKQNYTTGSFAATSKCAFVSCGFILWSHIEAGRTSSTTLA